MLIEGEKAKTFEMLKDGVGLDNTSYYQTYSMAGSHPAGHFHTASFFSSGIGLMNTGGSSFSSDLYIQPDGSFTRESASSTNYSNANQLGTSNVMVSSYANSSRKAAGIIRFRGNMAELTYPDGRVEREFAFTTADPKSGKLDYFNLSGKNYSLEKI